MKIVDIGLAYQIDNDPSTGSGHSWFFRVLCGPFENKEQADEFATLVGLLEPEETPPTLGINVSETIATKDRFG